MIWVIKISIQLSSESNRNRFFRELERRNKEALQRSKQWQQLKAFYRDQETQNERQYIKRQERKGFGRLPYLIFPAFLTDISPVMIVIRNY